MITELAATITTSNAINAEMLSTRPSLGLAHLSPDESLSAVHERVRESLSASLDRLFSRDANGESALSRKRRGVDSESDPGNVDAQAQDAPLPLTSTPGNTSSQVHEIQLPSTSTQNPPADPMMQRPLSRIPIQALVVLHRQHRLQTLFPGYYFAPWQYPNPIVPWYPPGQQMYQPDTLTWPPVQPQLLLCTEPGSGDDGG
uniref:(northern house mosquito) hypothetical protein n=1 Tax=Culex pipiens TaxID=7175 RepID=A0A8D8J4Z1_CULPI